MNITLTQKQCTEVQDTLIEQLGIDREQVTPDARIEEDLGADSLDKVEITMRIEALFNITIPDDEAERVVTVEDLYEALAAQLGRGR